MRALGTAAQPSRARAVARRTRSRGARARTAQAFLGTTYDTICCLLLIKIAAAHEHLVAQRGVSGQLEGFFEKVSELVWARYFECVEHQQHSLGKTASPPPSSLDVHPLPVSRRYAELSASLHLLASGAAEQRVLSSTSTLRSTMHALLTQRLGGVLRQQRKKQATFLINNADVILSIMRERGAAGEDVRTFEELLDANKAIFVEEVLSAQFGRLIRFVKSTEGPLAQGGVGAVRQLDEFRQLEQIVKDFHANWKGGIEAINVEVMKSFSNLKNGMEILKQTLTQLLLYHTRFLDIVKQLHPDGGAFAQYMITISTIMTEIKTYSRNF